jgi:hypothetical protein
MFSTTGKNLRSSLIIILTSATLFFSTELTMAPSLAKAYFGTRLEMEKSATEIALVKIEKCEPCQKKTSGWTYGTQSQAKVLKTLKGTLPKTITIYGQENFICAQCNFPTGTSLVFLKKDGDIYHGANWIYSCLKVNDKNTQWIKAPNSRDIIDTTLDKAMKEIKNDLEALPKLEKLSAPAQTLLKAYSFCNEVTGEAAEPGAEFLAFKKLKEEKARAKGEIVLISQYGSAAGKLYAGILLTHINVKEGQNLLKSFADSKEQFLVRSGCKGYNEELGNASKRALESGSYNGIKLGK